MNINWGIVSIIVANFSILPVCVSFFRIKQIPDGFKYFIYLIWIYFFVNLTGTFFLLLRLSQYNTVITNLFVLFDFIYLYLMISFWNKKILSVSDFLIISILSFGWIYENILTSSLNVTNSGFRIIYSLILLLKGIEHINKVISNTRRNLLVNSNFIIGSTFILYYSYKAIYESVYYFSLKLNPNEYLYTYLVLLGINLISYLLYTIAILCMKKKIQLNTSY